MERAAADQIARTLPVSHAGVHRYSLRQLTTTLAAGALAARGLRPLTTLAAEALAAQIVNRTKLEYFAPVAHTPGFAAALVETLTRLRLDRLTPRDGDLRRLAGSWQAALRDNALADVATQLELALDAPSHPLLGLPLLLLDIQPANVLERDFLTWLAARAPVVENLQSAAPPTLASALEALQSQLFSDDATAPPSWNGVEFFSASGEGLECVEIARRIVTSGLPFDQCAVLCRHPARYQPLLEDAFRRAGIPAWFTRGSVRPDPAGRAFLSLLHCADEGLSASRFAEYLSLGQTAQPSGWERLVVDAAVIGGKHRWERRLAGLAEELKLRSGSDWLIARLDELRAFALPLIERLDTLRAPRRWGHWLDALRDLASAALDQPDGVQDLLDELEPMRDIGPVDLGAIISVLGEHLGAIRRAPQGTRYGQVFAGSIEEARGLTFQLVFVPGVCEGGFPTPHFDDPLLSTGLAEREAGERLLLRQAVAPATGQVVISWPRIELATGRARVPSFYVLEAARAAFGQSLDRRLIERTAESFIETRIGWPAPLDTAKAIDDAEYDLSRLRPAMTGEAAPGLAAYLETASPVLYRSLRTRWRRWSKKWTPADGFTVGAPEFSLRAMDYSPSRLQLYAACPYRFALRALLRLEPMEQSEAIERLDPLTRGSLFHEVQKRLFEATAGGAIAIAVLECVLDEVAAEYAERLAPAIPQVWKNEIERLRADLRGWLSTVSTDPSAWAPWKAEESFKELPIGEGWRLQGRMDLVEQAPNGAVRITDYKTGAFPDPPPVLTGGGEVLQPLLYALAAEQLWPGHSVAGGRLFYATLRGGYRSIDIPFTDDARDEAARLLTSIDAAITGEGLRAAPREDACEHCDYLPICGPYEEERTRRKLPKLEVLAQIRSVK
jgi:RecB family exonuclease